MKSIRIAYFTDTYLPQINGVTNTLERLRNYLGINGIKHMFLAPEYPGKFEENTKSNIKRFKSVSFPLYPECRLSIPRYSNLCRAADSFNPDIVHLVTPLGIGCVGLKYALERDIPIVSSFHTNFDIYLKYYKLECLEDLLWNFFRWFHGFSCMNFCPSTDTMNTLKEKGVKNLQIWSRGIDTEKFSPDQMDGDIRTKYNSKDKIIFLYVGRLAMEKDLDILLGSIKNINSKYHGKAQFIFVGDGPYADKIRKTTFDNIICTGYLRGKELSAMYASCDVFVFPSSTETFGNVVLEALASGLPVVAADTGGVKDSVIHNCNGLLCKPRDIESFTGAIELLMNNKNIIASLGTNARQSTLEKTWDSIFKRLISNYAIAVEQHGKMPKSA